MENTIVRAIDRLPPDGLTGRRKITTKKAEITAENVKDVISETIALHRQNASEITYLYDYYRGKQDVRFKDKYARENINNKVVVNKANQIVAFKTSFLLNEPVKYISESGNKTSNVNTLNEYMRAEDKESKDKEIVDWMHICGIGERLTLTDELADGAPFYIDTVDPREAYVIYSSRIGKRRMAGVLIQEDEDGTEVYTVYTKDKCFIVRGEEVTVEDHILGGIPLVEYENNFARMGSFEPVISILNQINLFESNSADAVEDYVNGFDVFQNCDIDDGTYGQLSIGGQAVKVKTTVPGMEAKVYRVASELSQVGVQTRINDLTQDYLEICGMPNRNGGSSTSDTGQAVIFRDGWSEAESRAKDTEKLFCRAEKEFLRVVLNICDAKSPVGLQLKDIQINFSRKNLNNLQSKLQAFCELLANPYVDPLDAYNALGDVFGDKNAAYRRGMAWYEKNESKELEEIEKQLDAEREKINGRIQTGGSDTEGTEQVIPEEA